MIAPGLIRFSNVTCLYDGSSQGLNLPVDVSMEPGTTTLVCGPSGAGKSTLLSLLVPFAAPTTGSITVNRVDLADIDVGEVGGAAGLGVPTSVALYRYYSRQHPFGCARIHGNRSLRSSPPPLPRVRDRAEHSSSPATGTA